MTAGEENRIHRELELSGLKIIKEVIDGVVYWCRVPDDAPGEAIDYARKSLKDEPNRARRIAARREKVRLITDKLGELKSQEEKIYRIAIHELPSWQNFVNKYRSMVVALQPPDYFLHHGLINGREHRLICEIRSIVPYSEYEKLENIRRELSELK